MVSKRDIANDWLPRYTGMDLELFGDYILLTNFRNYVDEFAARFDCTVHGEDRPMQAATSDQNLSIVNFGIGTANAATIMDLLVAREPEAVLFLGKCGGLKHSTEIGPVDLLCRDRDGATVAVEVKRRGEIDGVEQVSRYVEFLSRDPRLAPVRGMLAAQLIKPQAKVLAAERGIDCIELDYDELRGVESSALKLF